MGKLSNTFQKMITRSGSVEQPTAEVKAVSKPVDKEVGILGSFFETKTSLSDEVSISDKLLKANTDWVYRNNDVIAKEVASMDFELFQIGIKDGEIEYTEIEQHPLLDLLDKFNDVTTKADGLYITQTHKKLTGDAYWLLVGNGNNIEQIFPLQPDKVEVLLGDWTDSTKILVDGYKYKDTVNGKQVEITYKPEQVIPFKTPNPTNMIRGYGAVEAAASVIDLDYLTTELNKKFFQNGAITNFILSTEGKINDAQVKRLKAEFKSAYGGIKNAFKTMILGGGLKPINIQQSYKEMDFMQQLEWYRDKIMVLFGNTKASLGIIDDVNRASHESSIISWKRNSVKPDMQAIVDTLNEYLVPRYGDNLILGFKDPIPEDRQAKLDEVKLLVEQKLVSRNEARQLLGYTPAEGEEHDAIPIPMAIPPALQNVDTAKILRKRGWYKKLKDYQVYKGIGKELAKKEVQKRKENQITKTVKVTPIVHDRFSNEKIYEYANKQLGIVEQIEARFQNKVEQFILQVKKIALANYPEQQPKQYSKELFNEDDLLVQAGFDFEPLLKDVAVMAGNEALHLIDVKTPYFAFNYEETIRRNVRKFTESMLETQREKMVQIIAQGLQDGKSIAEIRRLMGDEFNNLSKIQSERIARTEVIRASNEASLDAWTETGVVEGKQWLTTEDGREDSECAALNGKIVWNLKGDFYAKENEFDNGDPPLHPNCRCVVLPVLDRDKHFEPSMLQKIVELEAQIDKRTKAYREIKEKELERDEYIKELEQLVGINE